MRKVNKLLGLVLFLCLSLVLATPVHAFDGRSGNRVSIAAGEIINDDLYVGANAFVLDGSVNGDVISGAQIITVNGKITGNLIAVAQTVVLNGTIAGDVLATGSVLYFGDKAQIGGDVLGAGYSLEVRKGSIVGRDAVMGAFQILLAGDVGRNVMAAANGLEIDGTVGGNVKAAIADSNQQQMALPPGMFINQSTVPVPPVDPGLKIDPAARISGNLDYVHSSDLTFPAGVVSGSISRESPPAQEKRPALEPTSSQKVGTWSLNLLRTLITLVLIGLLMFRLFPALMQSSTAKLAAQPWPSLGLGVVAYAGFFFLILLILLTAILGAVIFGLLTLGGLSAAIVWVGILALLALIVGFVLAASFLTKVVFGAAIGKWILSRTRPNLVEHRYWPMLIGVAVIVIVVALLSFPLIPGALGWLLNLVIVLFGLGALWLTGREALARKPVAAT